MGDFDALYAVKESRPLYHMKTGCDRKSNLGPLNGPSRKLWLIAPGKNAISTNDFRCQQRKMQSLHHQWASPLLLMQIWGHHRPFSVNGFITFVIFQLQSHPCIKGTENSIKVAFSQFLEKWRYCVFAWGGRPIYSHSDFDSNMPTVHLTCGRQFRLQQLVATPDYIRQCEYSWQKTFSVMTLVWRLGTNRRSNSRFAGWSFHTTYCTFELGWHPGISWKLWDVGLLGRGSIIVL